MDDRLGTLYLLYISLFLYKYNSFHNFILNYINYIQFYLLSELDLLFILLKNLTNHKKSKENVQLYFYLVF